MFKKSKFLVIMLVMVLTMSMIGCKKDDGKEADTSGTDTPAPTATTAPTIAPTKSTVPTEKPVVPAGYVVDFEDGNADFVMVDVSPIKADATTACELVDFNGSKAVKVTSEKGKQIQYLGVDISSLVGERIADVRTIEADITLELSDGKFFACSGFIYTRTGENNVEKGYPWSVYLADKNPKTVSATLEDSYSFIAGAKNIIIISKEVDNAFTALETSTTFYVDNIVFRDASGNPIAVDTTVGFDAPEGFGGEATDGGFSSNAVEVMKEMDSSTEEGKLWQYPQSNLIGQNPIKQIVFQLVGPDDSFNGSGAVGFNYGDGDWYQIDFTLEGEDNIIVIDIPAEIQEQLNYEAEGAIIQVGFWWGPTTCILTKVEFSDGSAPSKWGPNTVEVMKEMDSSTEEGKLWQYPQSNLIGQNPIKQIVCQLVGPDDSFNGSGAVGFNYGDGDWHQIDFTLEGEDNIIVIDIPAEIQEQLNYEAEGAIVQVGFWWGPTTCILTKVDFKTN